MSGPEQRYEDGIANNELENDASQREAVRLLQSLYEELCASENKKAGFLDRFLVPKTVAIRGLYFWGGVGRGKTFLMDLFYESLPFEKKRRLHFHRFMREVHLVLQDLQGEVDPIKRVAARFSCQAKVICFDEFFVNDITDAMLIAGLFDELFKLGVTLVATSNVEPDQLYENGLQRSKFLPAIALIKQHTIVHNMGGGIDYRLRALEAANIYHFPLDEAAERGLLKAFCDISPDVGKKGVALSIEGREINTRYCGDGVVWFDFEMICDGPRSQNDYIELAHVFQTVLIGNVPVFTESDDGQARRFISLVDEFYDRNVKLIVSAEAGITDLYQGYRLAFEFQRTESRLKEMQSSDYLGREHRP